MRFHFLVGRFAAMCAHPYAAWRTSSARGRLVVLLAYAGAVYAIVLATLMMRSSVRL
jgi:hypothetical protein